MLRRVRAEIRLGSLLHHLFEHWDATVLETSRRKIPESNPGYIFIKFNQPAQPPFAVHPGTQMPVCNVATFRQTLVLAHNATFVNIIDTFCARCATLEYLTSCIAIDITAVIGRILLAASGFTVFNGRIRISERCSRKICMFPEKSAEICRINLVKLEIFDLHIPHP
jgi:hypothetical protein